MDPYYFPFEIVDKNNLVIGENYYIKLNDGVIRDFLSKHRNLPVSHLKGTFVRLHRELERVTTTEYAVFKNVRIINQTYKLGLCNLMLVRYPEGYLASSGGCDTFSDRNRSINENREVFFAVNRWIFGKPNEQEIIAKQAITTLKPKLNNDVIGVIGEFRGTNKGGKTTRKKKYGKKRKIYRKHKTNKHFK